MFTAILSLPLILLSASIVAPPGGPPAIPELHEVPFVTHASTALRARYHTVADAARHGFFRYSDEDDMGAISYVNLHWTSSEDDPCQLWFDVRGRFIGADFCRPYTAQPPRLWSVDPRRWAMFIPHVHYAIRRPGGLRFGAVIAGNFAQAGGNPQRPDRRTLVRLKLAKNEREVAFIFAFPHIWDLAMWTIPNANGAFADTNPSVLPSRGAGGRM